MRRWLSPQVFGAFLALTLVVGSVSIAFADPRDFRLSNNSGRDIAQVYVARSNMEDWGNNLMPEGQVLSNGKNMPINFQDFTEGDCYYSIKVVSTGGEVGNLIKVNLCETGIVTFNE